MAGKEFSFQILLCWNACSFKYNGGYALGYIDNFGAISYSKLKYKKTYHKREREIDR